MKRYPLLLGVALLLLCKYPVRGQVKQDMIKQFTDYFEVLEHYFDDLTYNLNRSNTDHELYININWQNSALMKPDGHIISFLGRYNVLLSAVEILINGKILAINPRKIVGVRVGTHVLIPQTYRQANGHLRKVFFELLVDSKPQLLKHYYVDSEIRGGNSLSAHLTGERKSYVNTEYFYAVENTELVEKMPTTRKSLAALFGDQSAIASELIARNGLKLKREEDLVQLFSQMAKR